VTDENGQPIAGATLTLTNPELWPPDLRTNPPPLKTDASGCFTIPRLAPGKVTVSISAAGYRPKTYQIPSDTVDYKAVLKAKE